MPGKKRKKVDHVSAALGSIQRAKATATNANLQGLLDAERNLLKGAGRLQTVRRVTAAQRQVMKADKHAAEVKQLRKELNKLRKQAAS